MVVGEPVVEPAEAEVTEGLPVVAAAVLQSRGESFFSQLRPDNAGLPGWDNDARRRVHRRAVSDD